MGAPAWTAAVVCALSSSIAWSQPVPQPSAYLYFCARANAYYPAVTACPEGWIAVPMGAPAPPPQKTEAEEKEEIDRAVVSRPDALSVELFGRALNYSFDDDLAVSDHVAIGLGFSTWGHSSWWNGYDSRIIVVPAYANYYFSQGLERGFLTGGIDWVHATESGYSSSVFENDGLAAVAGGGFEFRTEGGFLFRLSGYMIVGRSFLINPGVSFGFAF